MGVGALADIEGNTTQFLQKCMSVIFAELSVYQTVYYQLICKLLIAFNHKFVLINVAINW